MQQSPVGNNEEQQGNVRRCVGGDLWRGCEKLLEGSQRLAPAGFGSRMSIGNDIESVASRSHTGRPLLSARHGNRLVVCCLLVCGVLLASCGRADRAAVVLRSVNVSEDRRTLTVTTDYANTVGCAKLPAGVEIQVRGLEVVVSAFVKAEPGVCTAECDQVTQTVTLDEPLPAGARFVAPPGADPGCGGVPVTP